MSNESGTPRFSQKERVFKVADKIIERLGTGMPFPRIQHALGLEDMPYTTFYRHARRLRDNVDLPPHLMPKNVARGEAIGSDEAGPTKPDKEQAETSTTAPQPKAEAAKPPAKLSPKKRKPVRPQKEEPANGNDGFDPSKWDDIEI